MVCPVDYSLCDQTVTLYHKQKDTIVRRVVDNCFFRWEDARTAYVNGNREERKFLLVMPCTQQIVFPGDRVFYGIGPEVALENWCAFIPVKVAGLVEVQYAAPYFWDGQLCHVEAGLKSHTW